MEITIQELNCPECKLQYDIVDRTPHMIPSCGHTLCEQCLLLKLQALSENINLICSEDSIECPFGNNIKFFPLNQSIFKMVGNQKSIDKFDEQSQQSLTRNQSPTVSSFQEEEKDSKEHSKSKINPKQQEIFEDDDEISESGNNFVCKEHKRRLKLVCMNDYQQICETCALFGVHKNHNFRPLEEVFKELDQKINETLGLFDVMKENQEKLNQFANDDNALNLYFDQMIEQDQKKIEDQIDLLIQQIQSRKSMLLKDIFDKNLEEKEKYKLHQQSTIQQLIETADKWKMGAQQKLIVLTNSSEACELPQEMFKDHLQQQDQILIDKGKFIIQSIEQFINNRGVIYPKGKYSFTISSQFYDSLVQNLVITQKQSVPRLTLLDNEFMHLNLPQLELRQNDESILKDQVYDDSSRFHFDENLPKNDYDQDLSTNQTHLSQSQQEQIIMPNDDLHNIQHRLQTESESMNNTSGFGTEDNIQFSDNLLNTDNQNLKCSDSDRVDIQDLPSSPYQEISIDKLDSRSIKRRSQTIVQEQIDKINERCLIQSQSKKSIVKLSKNIKINEKIELSINQIREDKLELVEIMQLELNEDACTLISQVMKGSQKIKVLKLIKDKINDDGAIKILNSLEFTNLQSLHLQNNYLTDRTLDHFVIMIRKKAQKDQLPSLKAIYLNQNQINCMNNKKKIEEIKKLGITITI